MKNYLTIIIMAATIFTSCVQKTCKKTIVFELQVTPFYTLYNLNISLVRRMRLWQGWECPYP